MGDHAVHPVRRSRAARVLAPLIALVLVGCASTTTASPDAERTGASSSAETSEESTAADVPVAVDTLGCPSAAVVQEVLVPVSGLDASRLEPVTATADGAERLDACGYQSTGHRVYAQFYFGSRPETVVPLYEGLGYRSTLLSDMGSIDTSGTWASLMSIPGREEELTFTINAAASWSDFAELHGLDTEAPDGVDSAAPITYAFGMW